MRPRPMAVFVLVACAALLAAASAPAVHATGPGPGSSGAIKPVPGQVVRPFVPPAHPYGPGHRGVGLAARPGDVVRAALPGRVAFAGEVARVGWVTVDHGGGLDTTYGPIDPRDVAAGQRVRRGQPIGRLAPAATHLHWGARLHGAYIDPLLLLARWEVHLVDHRRLLSWTRPGTRPGPTRVHGLPRRLAGTTSQHDPRDPRCRARRGTGPPPRSGPGVRGSNRERKHPCQSSPCASCSRRASTSGTRRAAGTRR